MSICTQSCQETPDSPPVRGCEESSDRCETLNFSHPLMGDTAERIQECRVIDVRREQRSFHEAIKRKNGRRNTD